ncbi:hypothetical protein JDV09_06980 [Mycobacterium sp. Y57]|uniref:hypothetical protein n=1 Tax=Mycolicibacterium xanthum TaxID=2796469 RepID=UPI001C846A57|nr:hypothetical protein [Mycolicibacterium xanthum]MBX7431853.1 hypothetical protein [Mycolicibacterium xanthum]
MSSTHRVRPTVAAALISAAVSCAGLMLTPAIAHAEPFAKGPYTWCPGQPKNFDMSDPPNWDWNVCHTYWNVMGVPGNVSQYVFEGAVPPVDPQYVHRPPTNCGLFYCQDPGT